LFARKCAVYFSTFSLMNRFRGGGNGRIILQDLKYTFILKLYKVIKRRKLSIGIQEQYSDQMKFLVPATENWILPEVLHKIGERIYDKLNLDFSFDFLCDVTDAVYSRVGPEFEYNLSEGTSTSCFIREDCSNAVFLASSTTKMSLRAQQYQAYLSGIKVVTMSTSDGIQTGIIKMGVPLYRNGVSSLVIYGPTGGNYDYQFVKNMKIPFFWRSYTAGLEKYNFLNNNIMPCSDPNERVRSVYYFPTCMSWSWRAGPGREVTDFLNWKMQISIVSQLVKLERVRVIYKEHPKNVFELPEVCRDQLIGIGVKIDKRKLHDVINDIDCAVVDYFASAASELTLMNIPLVFIDFGYRKIYKNAFGSIIKNTVHIEAEWSEKIWHGDLISAVQRVCDENVKKYPMLSEQYVDLDAQDEYYEDVIDAINRELFGVDCAPQG